MTYLGKEVIRKFKKIPFKEETKWSVCQELVTGKAWSQK